MIKVFNSENLNRDAVIDLWQVSFGDTREYIEFFLDNCPDYVCVEYFAENRLASMLFLLEGNLLGERCKYLYAACTEPSFRRRGIMESLIEFTAEYCKENEYSSIFLVPANEKLYSYYGKSGFKNSFTKKYIKMKSADIEIESFCTSDVDEIVNVKKKLLNSINGFIFDEKTLKYTVEEHLFNGGKVFLKYNEDNVILSFFYIDNLNLIVKELLTDFKDISLVFSEHFGNKNAENIYICTPLVYNSRDIVEEYAKCGMCLPLNEKTSELLKDRSDLYAGMYLD